LLHYKAFCFWRRTGPYKAHDKAELKTKIHERSDEKDIDASEEKVGNGMRSLKKSLAGIISRMVLVFPPETTHDGQWFCRFEPDGIALIKGFLKEKGYRFVDLVYTSLGSINTKKAICLKKSLGWAISPFDQEGVSCRNIVNSALKLNLESPYALSLRNILPLAILPDTNIIGFSIGFPSQLYHGLVLARVAKKLNPNLFVVLGGPLITSYITFVATLQEMTCAVDGIIAGFGEEPLAQLILCMNEKGDLRDIPNLYLPTTEGFRRNVRGWRPDKTNLFTIPDYGRSTLKREFDPSFPVRPSIGCYWGKCAFCVYPSMSNGTRVKRQFVVLKPEQLVEHIKVLMHNGSGSKFELCSDSLPPLYLKKFSKQILQSTLDIKWSAWACVDQRFTDASVLETMKRAGCESILLGMESACQRNLMRINKIQTRQDIDNVLSAFFSADIGLFLTLCIGFPGETYGEAMETIDYLRSLIARGTAVHRTQVRIYRFALMGNTPIAENFRDYGISSVDWSDMHYLDDDFTYRYEVTEGMSFEEVKKFVLKWRAKLGIQTDDSPQIMP
jgi:anaerobic magnesium-protoporphyrin IX monomethyl ester cyclase